MIQFNRSLWKGYSRKALAMAMALSVTAGTAAVWNALPAPVTVYAEETEDDLREQQEDLAARQEELENLRNESAETLEEQEAEKEVIQQQIDLKIEEIRLNQQAVDEMDARIEDASYQIAVKQQAIAEKEAEIEAAFSELQLRLRAISKTGSLTTLIQMIMSAENMEDYLLKSKAMERISEENEALMTELEAEMQVINADKDALEKEKDKIEKERKPFVEQQTKLHNSKMELDVLYSEVNAVTEQLNQDIDYYNAEIAQAEADQAALQDKIDELLAQSAGSGQAYISGSMYWPAPSCNYISSTFKYRWGKWHNGIDICGGGCYGTAVVAGADGVVTYSDWMSGYGWVVMIDHGTDESGYNVTTVYAHCAELYVYEGQYVSGGETIAAVGSSGNSTGPHLHFEVRLDGSPVDPISYGYVSTSGIIIDESL